MSEPSLLSPALFAREGLKILEEQMRYSRMMDLQFFGSELEPLTRRERIKARLSDYRKRIVTAWRVLRGDDIHEDCYW